jgi:hypothetical protein
MYHFITLIDETEVVHSQVIYENGLSKVIVNFERPTEEGFDSARCELPDYNWLHKTGFSNEEITFFEQLISDNFSIMYLDKIDKNT